MQVVNGGYTTLWVYLFLIRLAFHHSAPHFAGGFTEPKGFVTLLLYFRRAGLTTMASPSLLDLISVSGYQTASWIPFFDDCHIIFLAPVSCFDQVLAEDRRVNRVVRLHFRPPLFNPFRRLPPPALSQFPRSTPRGGHTSLPRLGDCSQRNLLPWLR
jgi:hypothetical protein